MVFYIAYANQEIVIFDEEYVILNWYLKTCIKKESLNE
jgi:hypothetical protein